MSWKLDPTHTSVQFSVRHMMISTVRGKFASVAADADFDPAHLGKATLVATADVSSIQTGDEGRDEHLKSGDFFDAGAYPELKLVVREVKQDEEDVDIEADLTIRDVTKPIRLKGEVHGPAKDPWGNQRIGFSVHGDVNREDFGLTWNQALETGGVLVGKKVKIELDAQFTKA